MAYIQTDLADRLGQVSARVDLDQADLARVLDTNPRTVSRWLHREASPRPDARERLLELIAVLERLSGVLQPSAAHDWLFTPNPQLDHRKPVELLRNGDYRRVLGAIDAMAEGVFVQGDVASSRLVAALDALERTPYRGTAFRHQAAQWHPLSGAGARSLGGRWNPPQSFATLYLGLDLQTVAAEFLRMAARHGRAPEDFLPRHVYRYRVELQALVDLSESSVREAVGLHGGDIYGDEPSTCQAIGEAAQHLGREGILAPSATGQGLILAIFVDRLQAGSTVDYEELEVWNAPPALAE